MGSFDSLRSDCKALNEKFNRLEMSNVELNSSNVELKLRNINLTNQINFYLEFSSKQLAQYLAMVIVEYTSRRLPSSWEELLKLPIWTKKRPNFTN
jgi:hypothetical protein